jgi:hypothetical protein
MRCTAKCAIGGNAIGEKGECCLNDQFALWSRVKYIWRDEQFQPAETATPCEVTDRSTCCALLHECGKCSGCVACSESAACNAQRICELRMAIAQWLWLWEFNERRKG